MNKELISIIIPIYNVEKYMDECLQSVVDQTYKNIEIILVDDGSNDLSGKKCDEWRSKDNRIKVIHKENGGLSSARNMGIKIAAGDYIAFVDSDDWIEPDMYEKLIRLIQKGDYCISACGIIRTDEPITKKKEIIKEWTAKDYIRRLLKVGTQEANQYAWNKLYLRGIITDNQYPEGLTDEDVEGTFKALLRCTRVIETTESLYHYRTDNDNSITAPIFNQKRLDYLIICDDIVQLAKDYGDEEIIKWAISFRKRANFGILSRMAVMSIEDVFLPEIIPIRNKLINEIRKDYLELMNMPMPISRKILISCFCVSYTMSAKLLSIKKFRVK